MSVTAWKERREGFEKKDLNYAKLNEDIGRYLSSEQEITSSNFNGEMIRDNLPRDTVFWEMYDQDHKTWYQQNVLDLSERLGNRLPFVKDVLVAWLTWWQYGRPAPSRPGEYGRWLRTDDIPSYPDPDPYPAQMFGDDDQYHDDMFEVGGRPVPYRIDSFLDDDDDDDIPGYSGAQFTDKRISSALSFSKGNVERAAAKLMNEM